MILKKRGKKICRACGALREIASSAFTRAPLSVKSAAFESQKDQIHPNGTGRSRFTVSFESALNRNVLWKCFSRQLPVLNIKNKHLSQPPNKLCFLYVMILYPSCCLRSSSVFCIMALDQTKVLDTALDKPLTLSSSGSSSSKTCPWLRLEEKVFFLLPTK